MVNFHAAKRINDIRPAIASAVLSILIMTAPALAQPTAGDPTLTIRSISAGQAATVIAASRRAAARLSVAVTAVVLDASGNVVSVARMDGASPASVEGAR